MRHLTKMVFFVWFSLSIACSGNKNKTPDDILQPSVMIPILVDVHLAEADAINRRVTPDSVRIILENHYHDIFQIHHVDKEDFLRSFDFYMQQSETFLEMYEKVIEQITVLEEEKLHFY